MASAITTIPFKPTEAHNNFISSPDNAKVYPLPINLRTYASKVSGIWEEVDPLELSDAGIRELRDLGPSIKEGNQKEHELKIINKLVYVGTSLEPYNSDKASPWLINSDGKIYLGEADFGRSFHISFMPTKPVAVGYMKVLQGKIISVDETSEFFKSEGRKGLLEHSLRILGIELGSIIGQNKPPKKYPKSSASPVAVNRNLELLKKVDTTPSATRRRLKVNVAARTETNDKVISIAAAATNPLTPVVPVAPAAATTPSSDSTCQCCVIM